MISGMNTKITRSEQLVYLEATTRLYEPWGSVWRRNIQVTQKSVRVNELGRSLGAKRIA